jgi:hypothetical protein
MNQPLVSLNHAADDVNLTSPCRADVHTVSPFENPLVLPVAMETNKVGSEAVLATPPSEGLSDAVMDVSVPLDITTATAAQIELLLDGMQVSRGIEWRIGARSMSSGPWLDMSRHGRTLACRLVGLY